MGGIRGSGSYERKRMKGTVTNDRALDIRYWNVEGVMKPGLRFEAAVGPQCLLTWVLRYRSKNSGWCWLIVIHEAMAH